MKVSVLSLRDQARGASTWGDIIVDVTGGTKILEVKGHLSAERNPYKVYDLVKRLDESEFVILEEPVGKGLAKMPVYIKALMQTTTPWSLYVHGGHYKKTSHLRQAFDSDAYTGKYVAPSEIAAELLPVDNAGELTIMPRLPQACSDDAVLGHLSAELPVSLGWVAFTSAVLPQKGSMPVALLAKSGFKVKLLSHSEELPGGPTSFVLLQRLLNDHQFVLDEEIKKYSRGPWLAKHEESGGAVKFCAGYKQVNEVLRGAGAHINLTSKSFAPGHLEYSTLEAMSIGIPCIVPSHQLIGSAPVESIDYTRPGKCDQVELAQVVERLLAMPEKVRRGKVMEAREYLRKCHDPKTYVDQLLEAMGA